MKVNNIYQRVEPEGFFKYQTVIYTIGCCFRSFEITLLQKVTLGEENVEIAGGIYSTLHSLAPLKTENVSLVRTDGGVVNKGVKLEVQTSPIASALVIKMRISRVTEDVTGKHYLTKLLVY